MLEFKNIFVTHTTENYWKYTERLIQSVITCTEKTIVVFCLNFDKKPTNDRVICVRYDDSTISLDDLNLADELTSDSKKETDVLYNILTHKPKIAKLLIENFKFDTAIYLDSDVLVLPNIEELFGYSDRIQTYPLFTKAVYETIFWNTEPQFTNGKWNCSCKTLADQMEIDYRNWYVGTGLFMFNSDCVGFIDDWISLCDHVGRTGDWRTIAPYHEETIANVLLWRIKAERRLPLSFLNATDAKFVERLYEFTDTNLTPFDHTNHSFDFYVRGTEPEYWSKIPLNKNWIKAIHGIKNVEEIDKALEIITNVYELEQRYF